MAGMSQPPAYTKTADFAGDESSAVSGRSTVRTSALDAEFAAIETTLDATLANLEQIQRDDGEIRDAMVKLHTLSTDVRGLLAAGQGTPRGAWVTATVYAVRDLVTQSGNTYIAPQAHTAGTFATDLAAGKWMLFTLGSGNTAGTVGFTPTATLAATTTQAAIEETDTENRALSAAALAAAGAVYTDLANGSDTAKGDALWKVKQSGTGATERTGHARNADLWLLTDFGGIVADGTDQTAAVVAWLGTLASTTSASYVVPFNCRFYPPTVLAAMPYGVAFIDLSGMNDFSSAGETCKAFGILTNDKAENDTHWRVGSGHHAVLNLNNYGGAGTLSASQRKASVLWCAGQFANGSTDKRGFRGAAIFQFTQETGASYWIETVRSLAPWLAIAGAYEEWASTETIGAAGTYRYYGNNHYVSASAIASGGAAPVHTTGTTGDWTWIDSIDRSVRIMDQYGRWLIGSGTMSATWRHKVAATDPNGGAYTFEGVATGISKQAQLRLTPTDGAAAESLQPFLRADATGGLQVVNSAASAVIQSWTDAGGTNHGEVCNTFSTAADLATTPSVNGVGVLYFANSGATSVTGFTNPSDGQIVECHFGNANTTLVNSANFTLQGSTNVTPTAGSVITMRRIPTSYTANRWVEVSRSIK